MLDDVIQDVAGIKKEYLPVPTFCPRFASHCTCTWCTLQAWQPRVGQAWHAAQHFTPPPPAAAAAARFPPPPPPRTLPIVASVKSLTTLHGRMFLRLKLRK